MLVIVTGGTGFVGKAIVRALLAHGHTPRLLLRSAPTISQTTAARSIFLEPDSRSVEVRGVDFSRPSEISGACQGAQALIHLVGIIAELGENTFERAHVDLTRHVLQAACEAGIRRYLHMSALGTRDGARSRYHRTKWAAEQLVRASTLDWTLFRPSLIHGGNGGFATLFEQLSRYSPFVPAIGGGRGRMQPIGVDQVARAFVAALSCPESIGQTYDLCGTERLELREILAAILAGLGRRRWILPIPFAVARLQARVLEYLWPKLLRRAPPLHRDQILMLEEDNIGDGAPADAAFGLIHPPLRETMFGTRSTGQT